MKNHHEVFNDSVGGTTADGNTIAPLPGEAGIPDVARRARSSISKKGLLAVGLLIISLVAVSAFSIQRFASSGKKSGDELRRVGDRPSSATAEPRRLDMTLPAVVTVPVVAVSASGPVIPALIPTAAEVAEPIGVRRTGQGAPATSGAKSIPPEDAPVMLMSSRPGVKTSVAPAGVGRSSRTSQSGDNTGELGPDSDPNDPIQATTRNLDGYQQQLRGLLDTLTRSTALATNQTPGASPVGAPASGGPSLGGPTTGALASGGVPQTAGLFGGQLQGSATPRVSAAMLGNRSLTLPKGTAFTCALKTKVISATSGFVGCQVQRNVFSDDGRVLLVERGSHLDGEYRVASVRPGTVRIPVLWTRIRTPNGITVDIDSPGTGPLGESGVDGYVDNRWVERIGAALLLSLIDDSVKLVIQSEASRSDSSGQANTVVLPSTTSTSSKLAEKVLDSTINIPPLIYQNQGGIVGIYVARDVDFSSVYALKPVAP